MHRALVLVAFLAPMLALAQDWLYLTYPGDTFTSIGKRYLKDWRDWSQVMRHNRIASDRVLPANTRIRIPVALMRTQPAPAVVTHVAGNVRVRSADGTFRPLAEGDRLSGGETVVTGPRSFASIRLADGSTINQPPSSRLAFERLAAYGDTGMVATTLDLQEGRLEARAAPQLAPAGGMQVKTPVAVAGLRGTEFRLNLGEDGKTLRGEVLTGAVAVAAQRREVVLNAGQGTLTQAGSPPQPARALLPPPDAQGLPTRIETLPIRFAWTATAPARAWRVQIAADAQFTRVLLEELTERPEIHWEHALPDGSYVLRLRAVDADGLEGRNRDHPFELDLRPLPPIPSAPAPGSRSHDGEVRFAWAMPEEAQGFLLQVAPVADFSREVQESRLPAVNSHAQRFLPGIWHWRMASLDERGRQRAWGPVQSFEVRPLPEAPPLGEARIEAGRVWLNWLPVAGAVHYELELAKDADFTSPLQRQRLDTTRAGLELKPGRYFWRVRALEADGQAGTPSRASPVVLPPAAPSALQARIEGNDLILHWQGEAVSYRVELAADAAFSRIVQRADSAVAQARLPRPEPGHYWLRVVAVGDDAVESTPSAPLALEVRRLVPWWMLPFFMLPFI
ncbi:MAG: FecR domain-containing protein [Burkholderiales bacterium]|nr:FecR domain-containing protein [Burkholderiales bacterium]